MAIVVSDTSPVRALSQLNQLHLLEKLFAEVLIPPAVADELARPRQSAQPVLVSGIPFLRIQAPKDAARVQQLERSLDIGESQALHLRWR